MFKLTDGRPSACLDGLQRLGANNSVPLAKNKLDKHLNQQAHK